MSSHALKNDYFPSVHKDFGLRDRICFFRRRYCKGYGMIRPLYLPLELENEKYYKFTKKHLSGIHMT